jgi:hypothetical protein
MNVSRFEISVHDIASLTMTVSHSIVVDHGRSS